MDNKLKKKVISHYTKLLDCYGYSQKSVGWGNKKGKQSIRYFILTQIGKIEKTKILDVGCGFGDFYGYLKYKKINVQYCGIDITPGLIDSAKKIYPNANFEVRDFEKHKFTKKFDWVFFSGISSAGVNYKIIKKIMHEMFRICNNGIALNFVGGVVDFKSQDVFYSDPEEIYKITRELSNRVVIRHDYMPYEFTVYIYKNDKKTNNLIFKQFLNNSKMTFNDDNWKKSKRDR